MPSSRRPLLERPPFAVLLLCLLPGVSRPAPAGAGDEVRLTAALDAVRSGEIRSDLYFFASDELRGRDTPSLEQRVAARFVRARLERLGFEPGAGKSYFHEYPLRSRRIDPERARLQAAGSGAELELAFGRDYFVLSSQDLVAHEVEADVVYCGAGEREDFERAQVRGSWALCLTSELSARRRVRNAESAGVAGLILIADPGASADPAAEECARVTEYALRGLNSLPQEAESERRVLPQVFLTLEAGRKLLSALGSSALPQIGARLAGRVKEVRAGSGPIQAENVCGFWPGSDAALAREVLIVSAHYDHDGVKNGSVYPGADDNGSGSMGLLALAEALNRYGPMRRSVLLLWLSGEEKGLWGSAAWTRNPTLPAGHRAVCDLNIDMIGRNAPDYLLITPTRKLEQYNGLSRLAEALGPLEGFPVLGSADEYWERSDHMNFAVHMKLPVAFLFSDVHEDYHKPSDTPDKIDYDKVRRVVRLVLRILDGLQADVLSF